MSSFISLIEKYSLELEMVLNRGCFFKKGNNIALPNATDAKISTTEVLKHFLSNLKQAPVYYLAVAPLDKFKASVISYASKSEKQEQSKAKQAANKIVRLLETTGHQAWSCFQGNAAKKINALLDKDTLHLTKDEYQLLFDLANLLASFRKGDQIFYIKNAMMKIVRDLRQKSPFLSIALLQDSWRPVLSYPELENPADFYFCLSAHFHICAKSTLASNDFQFMESLVQKKTQSKDPDFKNVLQSLLSLAIFYSLGQKWDLIVDEERLSVAIINNSIKTEKAILDTFTDEFLHYPSSYQELNKTSIRLFEDNKNIDQVAEEVRTFNSDTNESFDLFYKGIYQKITAYQAIHSESLLPLVNPIDFVSSKAFISPEDLDIPLLKQIPLWEKQAQKELKKPPAPTASTSTSSKKNNSKNKRNSFLQTTSVPTPTPPIDTTYEKTSSCSSSAFPEAISIPSINTAASSQTLVKSISTPPALVADSLPPEESIQVVDGRPTTPTPATPNASSAITNIQLAPASSHVCNKITSLHQSFLESSPFRVKERLTDWFDPSKNLTTLNHESPFFHNFAWAANEILWKFGLRYPRKNTTEQIQPALAILCQVEHPMYRKSELLRITATFDHVLSETSLKSASSLVYDTSWECYHRTLTRKTQIQEDVEEYIENGKKQFVDFPALPSQRLQIEFSPDLLKKVYPDQSFIDSFEGGIVTIRDPKHDVGRNKCVLRLFVVR